MLYLWSLSIIILLFLIICAVVLNVQAEEVYKRENLLFERIWNGVNKTPLLIESARKLKIKSNEVEILKTRAEILAGVYDAPQAANLEKALKKELVGLFRQEDAEDVLFIALKKEMEEALDAVDIAVNDYNFAVANWEKYCRQPWFKILAFLFVARQKKTAAMP